MKFKKSISILMFLVGIIANIHMIFADIPYKNYTYSYWGEMKEAPQAYVVSNVITGEKIGCGSFREPQGLFVKGSYSYIADTGNNRIVICDNNWNLIKIIDSVKINGKESALSGPNDVFVSSEDEIYIADTGNQRILRLNQEGEVIKEINKPKSELITATFKFEPMKLVVDRANRIYVVARNINQGIMEIDSQGTFNGYVGANKVAPNIKDYLWKKFSTKEQRARMQLFVPTEFNNIFLDHKGFLYTTTSVMNQVKLKSTIGNRGGGESHTPIKKLNSMGIDILRRKGHYPPVGDIQFENKGTVNGPSEILDVVVDNQDIYSLLDRKRGRIFTYDFEGNLLYVFGGIGNQEGNFRNPVAIEKIEDKLLVLDFTMNRVTEFKPTEYGMMINEALKDYKMGRYEASATKWKQVLKMNANFDLAYVGIGRSYYREGEFEEALRHFKLGNDYNNYSKTYKLYRKEVIEEKFSAIMLGIIAITLIGVIYFQWKKRRRKECGNAKST